MSKVKLSKAELAALDALIASFGNEDSIKSSPDNFAFITAIARVTMAATKVTLRATPYVADVTEIVAGLSAKDSTDLSKLTDATGSLSLEALIKLREEANK